MPDLNFHIEGVEAVPFAAAPLLMFKVRVSQADGAAPIHSIALRCQVRIEPKRRRYDAAEQEGLVDLFGEPSRWGQTLKSVLWTHTTTVVPAFAGSTVADLPVPCTFDFNVAATKFFHALRDGEVPLCLLFSGTIFFAAPAGQLQVAQIPWEKEANYRLPVHVWQEMMDRHYPNTAWLCLRRDVVDRLSQYRSRRGLATWEQTLESLLSTAHEEARP